jgi:hypothetical protein
VCLLQKISSQRLIHLSLQLQTFGNLPYADRTHLDTLVEKLVSARLSIGELSYIYALIALAGISAPSMHPLSLIPNISSDIGHKRNIDMAIQLLILSQDDAEVKSESILIRCTCQTVISSYWIQDSNLDQAWYYAEMANLNAKAIGLYSEEQDILSPLFHRRNRLRTDLLFNGRFSSFVLSKETSIPSIDYSLVSKPTRQDGSVDHFKTHLLQMKTSGPLIGMQITDFVNRFHTYTDVEERKADALKLDKSLSQFVNSQSIQMLSLPDPRSVSLNDSHSSIHADRKLSVATSLLQMRILLAMPFLAGDCPDATLQKHGIRAARGLLTSFGLINHMLRSPWVSTFSKLYQGLMVEKAMSVFVVGMESFQSLATTARGDITWFSNCFPMLYNTLTSTGLGGPNAFEAAKMLLPVPIPGQERSLMCVDMGPDEDEEEQQQQQERHTISTL